jgi:hypothetical protein
VKEHLSSLNLRTMPLCCLQRACHLDVIEAIGEGRFLAIQSANVLRESDKRADGA